MRFLPLICFLIDAFIINDFAALRKSEEKYFWIAFRPLPA